MDAELVLSQRYGFGENRFAEIVIWRVPAPVRGSTHGYKYSFAFIAEEICVLRYDNEAGKGDHRHLGDVELPYRFAGIAKLRADFLSDVMRWLNENPDL